MFGGNFELNYYHQRQAELLREVEQERLIRCLEASRRAEQRQAHRVALHRQLLAAMGGQLVRLGSRMRQAALSAR